MKQSFLYVILSLIQSQEQRMEGRNLAFIILPLGVTHIARLEELLVHSECAAECVRGMRLLRHLQVLVQYWAVLWIHTVVDDLMRTLDWTLTTQVSNTVLGDDDLHRVLAVVVVANHWYEGRDSTTLSGRRSSIDADICVASKVA